MNLFDVAIQSEGAKLFASLGEDAKLAIPDSRKPKHPVSGRVRMGIKPQDIHFLVDPVMKLKMGDRIKVKFDMEKIQFSDTESELSLLWG